jgi:tetratricopeptide (TPR) repeat protein
MGLPRMSASMIRLIGALCLVLGSVLTAHSDVVDLLKAGLAARSRGDFDRAIYYYSQAIATGELDSSVLATVLNGRAVAYDIKGDPDKAIADLDEAIRRKPGYGEAYINRGLAWAHKRDFDRAIADFTEATTLDARFVYLAYGNRGIAFGEKGDTTRALQDLDEALRMRPDYADAYYSRAQVYNAIGDADKALADLDAAIRIQPRMRDAYVNRGVFLLAKDETDRAIADFDSAIRLDARDVVALGNRAYAYGSIGQYDRAIADLNEAIRLDPYNAAMYFKRGLTRLYSGRVDVAAQDFATVVRLRPSDAYGVIWLHLARVRERRDDSQEFIRNAAGIDRAKWPGVVVDLYLGSASYDVVSGSALSSGDPKARRRRACDVEFYLATFDLEQGAKDEAQRHLSAAVDLCAPGGIERVAARAELDAIEARR